MYNVREAMKVSFVRSEHDMDGKETHSIDVEEKHSMDGKEKHV